VVRSLGLEHDDVVRFVNTLETESAARPAIIWTQERPDNNPFLVTTPRKDGVSINHQFEVIPGSDADTWSRCQSVDLKLNIAAAGDFAEALTYHKFFDFIDLIAEGQNPGTHQLHEQGEIYCLDFSSVFAASVLAEATWEDKQHPRLIIDTCSSPGGKAVYAWRALKPERLICNEVIRSRISPLISNIKRCGITPSLVTNADTAHLAESLQKMADIVLVDAPCSGQSLPAKGARAVGAFHPATINMNSNRQKRILANATKMVAPGGYLAYMTCTFSIEENEGVIRWLLKRFPSFEPQRIPHLEGFRSRIMDTPCYRLLPHQGLGAGAFACLLKLNQPPENTTPHLDWQTIKCIWRHDTQLGNTPLGT